MGPDNSVPTRIPSLPTNRLSLKNKGIRIIEFENEKDLNLEVLDLYGNQIESLPKDMVFLKKLCLSGNLLQQLNEDLIDVLESYKSLEVLDISHNFFIEIPKLLHKIPKLKCLYCFGNRIVDCDLSLFKVESIDLGQNQIKVFPSFDIQIENIRLDFNLISVIDTCLPNLKSLCMTMNSITEITPKASFESLVILDISRNRLSSLPDFSIICPSLKQFDASHNQILCIPLFPKSISEIRMASNHIKQMPCIFKDLTQLVYLDLSNNKIKSVPELPVTIQTLILYNNLIETIEDSETPDLRTIEISHNYLEVSPVFRINEIVELSFFSNHLRVLRTEIFYEKIYRVDISDNDLESLPSDLFKLPTLVYLNVARNRLKCFPPAIASSPLIYLCFSENPIEVFPERLPPPLEQLYISGCSLTAIPDSIVRNEELVMLVASNNLIESIPYLPSLHHLDLSNNKLSRLPIVSYNIQSLDLSYNGIIGSYSTINFPFLKDFNISHNSISLMNLGFPQIELLNISNNPIECEYDFSPFTHLKNLDISSTSITVVSDYHFEFLSSIKNNNARIIHSSNGVAFSQKKKPQNYFQDSYISLFLDNRCYAFGILCSGCQSKNTNEAANYIQNSLCKNDSPLSFEEFESISSLYLRKLHCDESEGDSLLSLTLIRNNTLFMLRTGGIHLLIVDELGEICIWEKNRTPSLPLDKRSISWYKSIDNLSMLQSLGDNIVFGNEDSVIVKEIALLNNYKWLIMCSDVVFNVISEGEFKKLIHLSKSPLDLSYNLRNITYGSMYNYKISSLVVCLDSLTNVKQTDS